MRLIIDIGNTYTKLGTSISVNKIDNLCRYKNNNIKITEYITKFDIKSAIISNVGAENKEVINKLQQLNIPTINFNYNTNIPIINLYKTPNTHGLDRLAGIIGANTLYKNKNLLIIDAGTAITFDLINSNNQYLGGNISPGLEMRFKSLNTFTQKLPLVNINNKFNLFGNSTETAIISGVQQGMINEIDAYIDLFNEKYENLTTILTGGDSFFFEKNIKNSIFANSELILIGLNNILLYND